MASRAGLACLFDEGGNRLCGSGERTDKHDRQEDLQDGLRDDP